MPIADDFRAIRDVTVLLSELAPEDREPFHRHMMDTSPRNVPAPLPGDVDGDHRYWLADFKRWKNRG